MQTEVLELVRQDTLDRAVDNFKQCGNRITLLKTLHGLRFEFDDALAYMDYVQRETEK